MTDEKNAKQVAGGIARAKSLTADERSQIAEKAAFARWTKGLTKATHKGVLKVGDAEIPCYVLQDGRRLLSQRGSIASLGMSPGTGGNAGADRLASFAGGKGISPFISAQLVALITNPIQFVAGYTKDFVYERLAPGILDELERRNPVNENGARKAKHHQWMTPDLGHPELSKHIHAIVGLMRAAGSWEDLRKMMNRAFPKKGSTLELPFTDLV